MKMILLGTGTSHGIPCIACDCDVCTSSDSRDKRLRCSAYVTSASDVDTRILIDIGPEFRIQALQNNIRKVDAILLTHSHADHLHGLDDIRIFSHTISSSNLTNPNKGKETQGPGLPIFANDQTIEDVKSRFSYVFHSTQIGGGKPKIRLVEDKALENESFSELGNIEVIPIPMLHGNLKTTGWLLKELNLKDGMKHSILYLTDLSSIEDSTVEKIIKNVDVLDHLVIDALREEPHSTHYSFGDALSLAERLKPKHTWFIHMCHAHKHVDIQAYINNHLKDYPSLESIVASGGSVEPAYDGLEINT